jgi:glycosyltransferase involved in cell wall biosynthesis
MEALVSVVIPCYNGARFLREAIESVLTQNYPRVEVIVVNDGSTDNSAAIAAEYPGVRCMHQRNAGVAAARNTGLRHSAGDYLVFLDADDRLLPGALKSNLDCLMKEPNCAFAFGDVQAVDVDGSPLPLCSTSPHEGKEHYLSLLYNNYIWTPGAVMYRRGVLNALGGFDPRVASAADLELNLRITRKCQVIHNATMVLEYRKHPASMNQDHSVMLSDSISVLRRHMQWARQDPCYMEALRHGMRFFAQYYGGPLVSQLGGDIRRGRNWRRVWRGTLGLLRYAPGVACSRAATAGKKRLLEHILTLASVLRAWVDRGGTW